MKNSFSNLFKTRSLATKQLLRRRLAYLLCCLVVYLGIAAPAHAVYVNRYSTITNGALTFTGNTLGLDMTANANAPGTSGSIGTFISLNTALVDGTYPAGTTGDWTKNGSAATLNIPSGSTVLYAELIWSGSYSYGGEDVSASINKPVTFITPNGTFQVSGAAATSQTLGTVGAGGTCASAPCIYVRSADVTAQVLAAGGGTYSTGAVPATQSASEANANTAGWTLAVVYQNGSMPSRNLSLFVGAERGGFAPATVSGFCTPPTGPRSGRLLVSALEGDASIAGDQMRFGPTAATVAAISGPNNPIGNFFSGQINSDSGLLDTSGSFGNSNHVPGTSRSGARQGYDIANVDVSAQLVNNQTVAAAQGTTTGDQYLINALGLQINVGAPIFPLSVKLVDKAVTAVGDVLTYTISLDNRTGTADAVNLVFKDLLPPGLSQISGTVTVDGVATPGDVIAGISIGTVAAGATKVVSFKARVDSIPSAPAAASYLNAANWTYDFIPCAGQPTSRGNVTTNPALTTIARLNVSKTASPSGSVSPGGQITYTVTSTNNGLAPTVAATLRDVIPSGVTYVASSTKLNGAAVADVGAAMPWALEQRLNSISQAPGVLAVGASAVLTFNVTVNANASGIITNNATADVDGSAGGAPSVSAQVSNSVGLVADVSMAKSGPSVFTPGASVRYNLVISNAGPSNANGASFNDVVPTAITGLSASCGSPVGGAGCPASVGVSGQTVSGLVPTLPAGGSVTISIDGTVASGALGAITNTATASVPSGTTDPSTTNNSSSVTTTVNPVADVVVVKSAPVRATAGSAIIYSFVIRNDGPSPAAGTTFSDNVPALVTGITASCGSVTGGAVCPSAVGLSGNLVSGLVPTLPAGASVTITVNGTVSPSASGSIVNTATANPPSGTLDPNTTNNTSTVSTSTGAVADLSITKTAPNAIVPGQSIAYSLVVTNSGPSAVTGASFLDNVPNAITGVIASCVGAAGGATCPATVNVVGNSVSSTLGLVPAGGSLTFTIGGTVSAGATTAIVNSATITPPSGVVDPTPGNNGATVSTAVNAQADLVTLKTGPATISAGGLISYNIIVRNDGPSDLANVSFSDNSPVDLSGVSASCSASSNGATCPVGFSVSGSAVTATIGVMPAGSSVTIVISGYVSGTASATIINTARADTPAGVTDTNPANNASTVSTSVNPVARLSITKTAPASVTAGGPITYTITINNAGPSPANNASFIDAVPTNITGVTASCSGAAGGAVCPATVSVNGANVVSGLVPTLPAGGSATFTIAGTVSPTSAGAISNSTTVTTPIGVTDPDPSDNTSTVVTPVNAVADVSVLKSGPSSVDAGGLITYTVLISNAGPSAANGTSFSDVVPGSISTITANCGSQSNGAVCPASIAITGNTVSGTIANLPAGGSLVITIQGRVSGSATGSLINSATATVAGGVTDPNIANNTSGTTTAVRAIADLRITKTAAATVNAGGQLVYTIVVSNAGPSAANGATFSDSVPSILSGVSASCSSANGGAVCPSSVLVTGNSVSAVMPVVPAGSSITFTVSGAVNGSATGSIVNTASVTAPAGLTDLDISNNSATNTVRIIPVADVSVVKTGQSSFSAGSLISYTVLISNAGPSAAGGTSFNDAVPAAINSVTASCGSATNGAVCPASISVVGNSVSGIIATLPSGSSLTITISGRVSAGATGTITNTATITLPSGTFDPNPGNNTSSASTPVTPTADLSIVKTAPSAATPGSTITYQLLISNAGPSPAPATTFADAVASVINGVTATCGSASGGAVCPASVTVSGNNVSGSIPTLPAGGSVVITIVGSLSASATGSVANMATVSAPVGTVDSSLTNNTSAVSTSLVPTADLAVVKTLVSPSGSLIPGQTVTWKIELTNAGPSSVQGARLVDALPVGIASASWSCVAQGVADCDTTTAGTGASGTGALNLNSIQLDAGAANKITVTFISTVANNASGSITNTATATVPSGTIDPNPSNNTGSSTTAVQLTADLTVAKTGPATVDAGAVISYSVVVSNAGPSDVSGASFIDNVPVGVTGVTASCAVTLGSAQCPSVVGVSGNNVSASIPFIPAGGSVTFTVAGTISGSAPASITNTASINLPGNVVDPTPANNSSATTSVVPVADLSVVKQGPAVIASGNAISYTITLKNAGPSNVANANFSDSVPVTISGLVVNCSGEMGGAICPNAINSTTNNLAALIPSLPAGSQLTITVSGTVSGSATGTITNTANLNPPAGTIDPNTTNNASTETTSVSPTVEVRMVKTTLTSPVRAGQAITYNLRISNSGPGAADDTVFSDIVPSAIIAVSARCEVPTASLAVCPAGIAVVGNSVNGSIASLPAGSSIDILISGVVSGSATGSITNTARASAPVGSVDSDTTNNQDSVTDTIVPVADIRVTKTAATSIQPLQPLSWTIVVTNAGPSAAGGTSFSDLVPSTLTGVAATCAGATNGAVCPTTVSVIGNTVSAVIPTLPANGTVTFTVTGTVIGSATGVISNTASATAPAGFFDPNLANDSATATTGISAAADLQILKTGPSSVNAGGIIEYSIVLSNNGPSAAGGTAFTDTVPAQINTITVDCTTVTGGAICPASISLVGNAVAATVPTLPSGSSITFTIRGAVLGSASGSFTNSATLVPPAGLTDLTPNGNTSSVTTTVTPVANVSIEKLAPAAVNAGASIGWQLRIRNAGPSIANGTRFNDVVPAIVTGVTGSCAAASGGAACPTTVGVSGNTVSGVIATLPPGGEVLIQVNGVVSGGAVGTVNNTASVTPPVGTIDPNPADNTSSVSTPVNPVADVQITKTAPATANAGGAIQYLIKVLNAGPSSANQTRIVDVVPSSVVALSATCGSATGGAVCPSIVDVTGNQVSALIPILPVGGVLYLTVNGTVAGAATGAINNTATATLAPGVIDPDTTNNASTVTTNVQLVADVRVTKTGPASANAGATVNYTVVVVNSGPSAANGTVVTDAVPASLTSVSATCTGVTGNAVCPAVNVSGNNVSATIATLPSGSTVSFNVQGVVLGGAVGSITNSVTVTPPVGVIDPDPTNNTALSNSPVQPVADLKIEKIAPVSVNAGAPISYQLLISNAGPSPANLSSFLDSVPSSVRVTGALCNNAQGGAVCPNVLVSANNVSGTIAVLPAASSMTIIINGVVLGSATGVIANTASVTPAAGALDPNAVNNNSQANTNIVPVANLSLRKTGPNSANVSGPISYSLIIANAGPSSADGASFSDAVPSVITGLTVTCTASSGGAVCPTSISNISNLVSGVIPTMPANSSITIVINGTVGVTSAANIVNTATVSVPSGTVDPDPSNDTGAAVTPINPVADLKIEKFAPVQLNAQDPIVYTVKVTNLGPSTALNSTMIDTVPAMVSGLTASCNTPQGGGVCPANIGIVGNDVTAVIPSLPAGASVQFTIGGALTTNASGSVVNTASVSPGAGVLDLNVGNNSAQAGTLVTPLADLSITKTRVSPTGNLAPGALVTYQIVVKNAGPANAAGIKVEDVLPASLASATWVCTTTGIADCDTTVVGTGAIGSGSITLNNVSIDGGTGNEITIRVTARLAESAQYSVTNVASLTPPASVIDLNPANNTAVETSPVSTSLTGRAFADTNADGLQNGGEANLGGLTVTLTPVGGGTPIVVQTNANGDWVAAVATGVQYSVVITPPSGQVATTRNNPQLVTAGVEGSQGRTAPVGFAIASSLSGSVWRDFDHDRRNGGNEPKVAGFRVEVLDNSNQVVGFAITGIDGNYSVTGLIPSNPANPASLYKVRFIDPANNVVYGQALSADPTNPNGDTRNGDIEGLALLPGVNTNNQSLPLDPSGVVYNSATRLPVSGAIVEFIGPVGFDPATQLLGGLANVIQTTAANGYYEFWLLPSAPAGVYRIKVTAPVGLISPSIQIPVQPNDLLVPSTGSPFTVQSQASAPAIGQATTHYFGFQIAPGVDHIVNNHIPLDSAQATELFVTKVADKVEAELGDSIQYTVSIRSVSGPAVSDLVVADRLPAGFKYIAGTASLKVGSVVTPIADPSGGAGPNLNFRLGSLAPSQISLLSYRVRLGVGSQQGDGINRAQATAGRSKSNVAQARVKVTGGVFANEACIVGKVFVDCNRNHIQDPEELGIPGVRLYFEDGLYLISDTEGKYSYCGLKPITHVLKVDRSTLPPGSVLTTSSNRNAGDAGSLFIDAKFGELQRADFVEGSCRPAVLEQVKARRAQGNVVAPETEAKKKSGLQFRSKVDKLPVLRTPQPSDSASAGDAK